MPGILSPIGASDQPRQPSESPKRTPNTPPKSRLSPSKVRSTAEVAPPSLGPVETLGRPLFEAPDTNVIPSAGLPTEIQPSALSSAVEAKNVEHISETYVKGAYLLLSQNLFFS